MGKLIVIEGTDSTGKATQTNLLVGNLQDRETYKIDFPNYESESSVFVKNYLAGDYGKDSEQVDPYIASTFYALDRYDTYKKQIEKNYIKENTVFISDRYTTANMVHQASKIDNIKERDKYLEWLYDFEFNLLGLPKPDLVIFLNLEPKHSQKLMANRNNKITGEKEKDIHENNKEHLEKAYCNAKYVAEKYNWLTIECFNETTNTIKTKAEIQEEILKKVLKIL